MAGGSSCARVRDTSSTCSSIPHSRSSPATAWPSCRSRVGRDRSVSAPNGRLSRARKPRSPLTTASGPTPRALFRACYDRGGPPCVSVHDSSPPLPRSFLGLRSCRRATRDRRLCRRPAFRRRTARACRPGVRRRRTSGPRQRSLRSRPCRRACRPRSPCGALHRVRTTGWRRMTSRSRTSRSSRRRAGISSCSRRGRPATTENLAKLDRYREIAQRIAHPEGLTDGEAHALAREGKVLLHIDGGLHATESAGPQHTPLLAYDILRRANDPDMHAELENVILLLWPTINPDGQQMVAEYAAANEGRPFPGLYQAYVGHDNNRDAYMLNMVESRVMEHAWREWEPDIIHVHHQGAPAPSRIWFPPFAEPIATWAPPLMSREVNAIGMAMARAEDEVGHVGSSHMGRPYDAWYPGYIDYNPMFKNIVAYWTETAANGGGGPGGGRAGAPGHAERPQSLYSSPWTPGTPWNLRTAIEYMETASLAVLDFSAKYKESIIYDRYQSGRDQIARGRREAPYAYLVPQDQRDPVAAVELLRRLAFAGVRVSQLTASATVDGTSYPAGTWVVPTNQEFAAVAREVL